MKPAAKMCRRVSLRVGAEGGMDVSEALIPVAIFFLLAALVALVVTGRRVRSAWLRIPVRGIAGVGVVLMSLALALFILGEFACTARVPLSFSPDGKYVAILTFGLQGALGADLAHVRVRRRWSPYAKTVYDGPGDSGVPVGRETDPQVRWVDNKHLLIRYRDSGGAPGSGSEQTCTPHVYDVDVICARF